MSDLDPIFQSAGQQFGVDPNMLKALAMKESSMRPDAVNPESGASGIMGFMPANAKAYGINPLDPAQAITAAAQMFQESLKRSGGNIEQAVADHFAGPNPQLHGPKTAQYVSQVAGIFNNMRGQQAPAASEGGADATDDPILSALSGKPAVAESPTEGGGSDDPIMAALSGQSSPAKHGPVEYSDVTNDPNYKPDPNMLHVDASGTANSPVKTMPPDVPAAPTAAPQGASMLGEIGRQVGLTGRAALTGLTGLPNMVGDAANSAINLGTGGINSLTGLNIPQLQMPSQVTQDLMTQAGLPEPKNGLERVIQSGASALTGVGPSVAMGNALSKLASPTAAAIGTGLQQMPGMQMLGATGSGIGGQSAAEAGMGPVGQIAGSLAGGAMGVGAGTGITRLATGGSNNAQMLMAQALKDQQNNAMPEPIKPRVKLNIDGTQTELPPVVAPAAPVLPSTFAAPVETPVGMTKPTHQQLANIETMKKIGLDTQRKSAVSGDKFSAGQEYETAKLDNQVGKVAREQIAKEQTTLKNYAKGIIDDTGAPIGTPEASGQAIRAPMQALSEHFDGQIKDIYAAADKAAAGAPVVKLDTFGNLLGTNSVFAGKAENTALRRGIRAYAKEQDMNDGPVTVQTAEGMRQYLNSQWSPQNSGLIGKIKEALDSDVTKSAGGDIYKAARALHADRKNTLDNPNGIAKLLNVEGPNGINQAIPDEQVAPKLIGMPTGQFKHILDTLKSLPEALQPQGDAALNEIKAALAKRIYAAGDTGGTQNGPSVWNAANVTRELNAQKSKLALAFSPEELAKFKTLHDAGHILQTPMAYKGAAAQGYNFLQSGVLTGLPAAGAGLGAMIGGPMGAAVGGAAGSGASSLAKKGVEAAMAAKYAEALRNPTPKFGP